MEKIILIGGAPTVGKSYAARKISEQLGFPWISTDIIREMMRELVNKKDYSNLFLHSTGITAQKYLTKYSAKQIVGNQNKESRDVWRGVKALIKTDYVWKSFIIEGVAILPDVVKKIMKKDERIKPVFLYNGSREKIKKVIFTRGLWDDAEKYSDSLKYKEVEWVLLYDDWIKKQAKKYNLPLVDATDTAGCIKKIKTLI
ncbi:hypothetical protein KJ969_01350 [Patescibacteria group bacterium]|nr:hypothetical protein [Patescibacteria group bacterium]MBU1922332.1 hypothetical protein [Patescibacteria group bacterium]